MRLMRQYDLSKRLQPLNEGMVFSAQNDSHSLEGVGVGSCRGFGDGMITPSGAAVYHLPKRRPKPAPSTAPMCRADLVNG